jgi:linoleate 10R-lipoxygenase
MNGTFGSYRKAMKSMTIDDDGRSVPVNEGDNIFVSFVSAAHDPLVYPEPETVSLNRPMESYIHYGAGPHRCLGEDVSKVAMLKTVGRLDNLRRAPGPRGELKKIPRPGGFYIYMREDYGGYFPFPTSKCWHFCARR